MILGREQILIYPPQAEARACKYQQEERSFSRAEKLRPWDGLFLVRYPACDANKSEYGAVLNPWRLSPLF